MTLSIDYGSILSAQFGHKIAVIDSIPGYKQIVFPATHADGDMIEMYIDEQKTNDSKIHLTDLGTTLMRLSYDFDFSSEAKMSILDRIIKTNHGNLDGGEINIDSSKDKLLDSLMQLIQIVNKVANMNIYKREVLNSLFDEMLNDIITEKFTGIDIKKDYSPIPSMPQFVSDYWFSYDKCPFNFSINGVNTEKSALLTTASLQQFKLNDLKIISLTVLEDIAMISSSKKPFRMLMTASGKMYPSLQDFGNEAPEYIQSQVKLFSTLV
jgi:hypothetical protein